MTEKPATSQAEPARGGRSGWQDKGIKASRNQRINRAKQAAQLKRERVYDEWTAPELIAIQRDLRASFYARQNTKEQS